MEDDFFRIAKLKLDARLSLLCAELQSTFREVVQDCANRGIGGGGVVRQIYNREIEPLLWNFLRGGWDDLRTVFLAGNIEPKDGLEKELLELLQESLPFSVIRERVEAAFTIHSEITKAQFGPSAWGPIKHLYDRIFEQLRPDIEIFLLERRTELKRIAMTTNTTHITINGSTVAAIQTGSGNSATVSQRAAVPAAADLLAVMNRLIEEIDRRPDALPAQFTRDEVLEVVRDTKEEVSKPVPNKMKLVGTLSAVGHILQSTAAFKEVYGMFRPVAASYGLELPELP